MIDKNRATLNPSVSGAGSIEIPMAYRDFYAIIFNPA